jgi:hypothetical protein
MPITAGKVRILIATATGPVEVLLLAEEDPIIGRCVACIGGTTETADIAAAYHAFVVRPTGIVAGRFGHSCYRLDVSRRVNAGSSWQLGVLAAHGLLAERRLAQESDSADGILWATGSVRPVDLTVGAANDIADKLASSLDRLKEERAAGRRVMVALPAANAAEIPPPLAGELASLGIEVVALAHVELLFDALGLRLPDTPGKSSIGAPLPLSPPQVAPSQVAAAPRRRWIFGAAAATVLLGIAATAAVVLERKGESTLPSGPQLASGAPQPAAAPVPSAANAPAPTAEPASAATAPAASPAPAPAPRAPTRVALVPERVPLLSSEDRGRLRKEYMTAPDYKALATNLQSFTFVSGQATQEDADRAAVQKCQTIFPARRRPSRDAECELYASGNVVVSRRNPPPMPPEPWVVRNPSVERPFVAALTPLVNVKRKEAIEAYLRASRAKAIAISPNGGYGTSSGQASTDDAVRLSLERCGRVSGRACAVIAVDDTFVIPIPTLAKAVGFYRPDALFGIRAEARDEIARRLAAATEGWNAVAAGTDGNVGIAIGASSEQGALDGALADCAQHDRNCRVVVLGPFLVEAGLPGQAEVPPASAAAPARGAPAAAAPASIPLVPEQVPFLSADNRAHIRDEYMQAPDYKALATNLGTLAFVSGQPTQADADRAALQKCRALHTPSGATDCEVYASGNVVVSRRKPLLMPPEPWVVRDPSIERPFAANLAPLVSEANKQTLENYVRASKHKAVALAPNGIWASAATGKSEDDAARLALEWCSEKTGDQCVLIAIDDTFVIPIPTLAKAIAFYRPEALFDLREEFRADVARRLAAATKGWNAVAVGAGGHVGVMAGESSEKSAFDGAIADCAQHDSNCRIVVLGPFLVEALTPGQGAVEAQTPSRTGEQHAPPLPKPAPAPAPVPDQNPIQAQNQVPGQGGEQRAAPSPQPAPAPASPPAATPDQNQIQAQSPSQAPKQTAEQNAAPSPQPVPAPASPPAATPDQNQIQTQNPGRAPKQTAEQNASPSPQPAPTPASPPATKPDPNQIQTQNPSQALRQTAEQSALPSPQPAPAPAAPPRVELVPDLVPFITGHDRARIRDEYMGASDYKALATSLLQMAFVSGQPTQETADRAAMEACQKLASGNSYQTDRICELYASGNVVVTRRKAPPMPPLPWIVRNPAIEQPFAAALTPLAHDKDQLGKLYPPMAKTKVLVIATNGKWWSIAKVPGADEAVRRGLERCGYMSSTMCMVAAIDDTFVIPIPTLAKAVDFYRPAALSGVQPQARDEIARRLAAAPNAWNAVAVGAGGAVGIETSAASERSALDGALADCARHDHGCHIVVLGPFLVEPIDPNPIQAQKPSPLQGQGQPPAENAPPAPPQLASAPTPPAVVPLVPEQVPFITSLDRQRIRDEYMSAPDHKALATSLLKIAFVSGQATQEAADRAAMEACQKLDSGSAPNADKACDLYASGNVVVTRRRPPPMPPAPWIVRNPAVERPFVSSLIPLARLKDPLAIRYPHEAASKAFVVSSTGHWASSHSPSAEEAMRRSLERCGFMSSSACRVVAIDNTFVIPIPTLAKAIDFYRPEALSGVAPQARDAVARRLAGVPNAWNAVAVGAGGNVGIATSAASEQSAVNGALADCAAHDRNCRIVVLGPFMVEMVQAQPQRPAQVQPPAQNQMGYPKTGRTEYQKDAARP